jgi:single-stranded-DNA-specific exonuclease
MQTNKRWVVSPLISSEATESLSAFPPIIRQLLFNRGIARDADARAYINAAPNFDPDPFQMLNMEKAVARIRQALRNGEPIAIYGDYDVDGVTATALLVETLKALGGNVIPYIPNRFDEGYGLNNEALSSLMEQNIRLVISVDCGIRSPAEANHARSLGLDLIITDHHQPSDELPAAYAVLNPKQAGDSYPDKDLAGVGVAYKLAEAIASRAGSEFDRTRLLDLVALGTVADLAPLTGENRVLVRRGLDQLRNTRRQGIFSLAAVADLSLARINATSIGFVLGPRLNAAGRLESALAAYELLTATDVKRAGELAQQLNVQNRQRQELTRKIQEQADVLAMQEDPQATLLFAVHPEFNSGVVGLAAARLAEAYYRPAVVGQVGPETTRCSCRSIPEFHITQALDQCADLLIRHGGHAAAAGFTVRNENLDVLKDRLKQIAHQTLSSQDLRPTLQADLEVQLKDLNGELLRQLEYLQPTGYGNPDAVFVSRNLRVQSSRTVGSDGKHMKLVVTDGGGSFDAIAFRLGHLVKEMPERVDVLFTFETNEYNGRITFQLNVRDLRPAGVPD